VGLRPRLHTLTRPEDFKRAMALPWLAKTPHFALHHLLGSPLRPKGSPCNQGLSSPPSSVQAGPVDNSFENPVDKSLEKLAQAPAFGALRAEAPVADAAHTFALTPALTPALTSAQMPTRMPTQMPKQTPTPADPHAVWAGYVVPKRHARRAVTRNLIRRQMRQALTEQQGASAGLPPGIWVLRLRREFDYALYPSASSAPLKAAVREELERLLDHALRRHEQTGARR
jgi:ribonuclease P protein component